MIYSRIKQSFLYRSLQLISTALLLFTLVQPAWAQGLGPIHDFNPEFRSDIDIYRSQAGDIVFENSDLNNINLVLPTTLDFGPDGRLYVGQKNGLIIAYDYVRNGSQDFEVTAEEKIFTLKVNTLNHDDDGEPNTSEIPQDGWVLNMAIERQLTGIHVVGTAENPIIYATSSDPRAGAFHEGDVNLDTNSGVVHRLTKENGSWKKVDLVRGLPRNEENHATNGLQLDEANNILYVAVGGMTNAGSPSNFFAYATEYALSGAIIKIDLNVIDAMPVLGSGEKLYIYDLPTLDDPTRDNANGINDPNADGYDGVDLNDPFGGNNGLNQAKIVEGGPVQLHATGFRNPYDVLIMKSPGHEGRMYSIDNGANGGWGGFPEGEDEYPGGTSPGTCTNAYVDGEPGSNEAVGNDAKVNNLNGLHYIREVEEGKRYYAGHPAPVRGNPEGAGLYTRFDDVGVFRTSKEGENPLPADWPPVPASEQYAAECDFRNPGVDDGALVSYGPLISVNGLAEYRSTVFDGALQGSILSVNMTGVTYIAQLNETGDQVVNGDNGVEILFQSVGGAPLDLAIQDDNDPYPGTVWLTRYDPLNEHDKITIFDPVKSTVANEKEGIPSDFQLRGNYPNPFNDETIITMDLPQPAVVTIEVFDMLGRKVFESSKNQMTAGHNQKVTFSGTDLVSGNYVYRVNAAMPTKTLTKTGRLTFVK